MKENLQNVIKISKTLLQLQKKMFCGRFLIDFEIFRATHSQVF